MPLCFQTTGEIFDAQVFICFGDECNPHDMDSFDWPLKIMETAFFRSKTSIL